ncbi:MAG: beta-ketoacyl synthase N-terminal-like domain-containing protein [Bacteroidales bacterium]|jgi:3-oxoacyl-[acyl-carrier-protein] synthase-1
MMYKIGDSILSPLGATTEDNYQAVRSGKTGIRQFPAGFRGLPKAVLASLIDPRDLELLAAPYCGATTHQATRYRQAMAAVLESAVTHTVPEFYKKELVESRKVAVVFCTTKGDVDSFREWSDQVVKPNLFPWHVAQRMMDELRINGKPFVVMNSTLSGMQAMITANRLLSKGTPYDFVIVIGVELISPFTMFLFEQAGLVGDTMVRPFDTSCDSTNPGESAACAIFVREERFLKDRPLLKMQEAIKFKAGVVTTEPCGIFNELQYISQEEQQTHAEAKASCSGQEYARQGMAMQRAIRKVLAQENMRNLSFINMHGVGKRFFDDITSVAIEKAGLRKIPVNCFEANFGHSSGSTSLLDSILAAKSLERREILPTLGYREHGVEGHIQVVTEVKSSAKNSFMAVSSGFGGVNATVLFSREK